MAPLEDDGLGEILKSIRASIAALRRNRRLTTKQVARKMGSTVRHVTALESGLGQDLRLSTLARAAWALGGRLEVRIVRKKRRSNRRRRPELTLVRGAGDEEARARA